MSSDEIYYKIDDSNDPGYARVEIIGTPKQYKGAVHKIRILEIIKPSSFMRCKVGSIKTVNNTLLSNTI